MLPNPIWMQPEHCNKQEVCILGDKHLLHEHSSTLVITRRRLFSGRSLLLIDPAEKRKKTGE